ncbi:MAG: hypothetical protein LUE86_14005 [Clostridiales bacterium]|nr:hypothetical protein [Clostridiales bacterium]
MKDTTIKIMDDLKKNLFDSTEKGTRITRTFADLCNSFSNDFVEITEAIIGDPQIFQNFTILASACAIRMGYTWEQDEHNSYYPHWDARKKASEEFCYEHMATFLKIFEEAAGFRFPLNEDKQYAHFQRDCDLMATKLTRKSDLMAEIEAMSIEHPTLRQKSTGLFCRIMGAGGIRSELLADVWFPFI